MKPDKSSITVTLDVDSSEAQATLNEYQRTIEQLRAERDEADRRAGAAERQLADAQDTVVKRRNWLDRAREERGYLHNISFDRVWRETCVQADMVPGLRDLLGRLQLFIANGVELGAIRMPDPDTPDPAHETVRLLGEAVAALSTLPAPRGPGPQLTSSWAIISMATSHTERAQALSTTAGEYYGRPEMITAYVAGWQACANKLEVE